METTETNVETTETTQTEAPVSKKRTRRVKKTEAAPVSRIVTATLDVRMMRIVFKNGAKTVHTSPIYRTRNIVSKVVAFARQKSAGKASGAKPIAQVLGTDGKSWKTVTE